MNIGCPNKIPYQESCFGFHRRSLNKISKPQQRHFLIQSGKSNSSIHLKTHSVSSLALKSRKLQNWLPWLCNILARIFNRSISFYMTFISPYRKYTCFKFFAILIWCYHVFVSSLTKTQSSNNKRNMVYTLLDQLTMIKLITLGMDIFYGNPDANLDLSTKSKKPSAKSLSSKYFPRLTSPQQQQKYDCNTSRRQ